MVCVSATLASNWRFTVWLVRLPMLLLPTAQDSRPFCRLSVPRPLMSRPASSVTVTVSGVLTNSMPWGSRSSMSIEVKPEVSRMGMDRL